MQVKRKVYMRLDELIRHIYENKIISRIFPTSTVDGTVEGVEVIVSAHGEVSCRNITKGHAFPVEVEEALTEDTMLDGMTGVYYDRRRKELDLTVMQRTAIKYQLGDDVDDILLAIYVGPTLIWSRESGIPEDGILEVDVERPNNLNPSHRKSSRSV